MSKEYIDVLPTNVNQVQSVSYHDGNPLVEFKIGAQERYLLGSTIRLNGVLSVFKEYIMTTVKHADNDIAQGEDPQITRNFINAVSPFTKLRRTSVSPLNTPGTIEVNSSLPDAGNIFGIGCALDTISNQGVDYSNSQFGMVINSDLADDNPQSVFVFVHAKQTLLMNAQGIQVLS